MSFTDYLEQKTMDHIFNKAVFTAPTLYLGLSSTTVSDSGGNVTEPVEASYARVTTATGDWTISQVGGTTLSKNNVEMTFPEAAEDWASGSNLTYGLLFDSPTAGNLLAFAALTTPRAVLAGNIVFFPIDSIQFGIE